MYRRLRNVLVIGCVLILAAAYARENVILRTGDSARLDAGILEKAQVERGDIRLTVSASGPLRANREVPLAFAATGQVEAIYVREGDRVLKGQALAKLDTQAQEMALKSAQLAYDLQRLAYNALAAPPREVDQRAAEVALKAAQTQLRAAGIGYDPIQVQIAELQVEIAKNSLWQSQLVRDQAVQTTGEQAALSQRINDVLGQLPAEIREGVLGALGSVPLPSFGALALSPSEAEAQIRARDYDVDIAQTQLQQAQKQGGNAGNIAAAQLAVTAAQSTLDRLLEGADPETLAIAEAQLKAARTALDLAAYNLSQATLTAPFEGAVARINLALGEAPPLDRPAIILIDDSSFYLDVPVDEVDIAKVKVGQPATLSFDALPGQVVEGQVSRVAEVATNVGDVVTYTVRVNIAFSDQVLRSGMSATATVIVDEIDGVLRVRNRFVRLDRRTGRATVTLQTPDGRLRDVEVVLGLRNETYSEVKSGLTEGDVVVVLPRELNFFQ